MHQDLTPTEPQAVVPAAQEPADVTPAASSSPAYDPAYIAQLEQAYNQARGYIERIQPLAEEVEWALGDPTRADGLKRYRKAFEESSRPEIDPVLAPVIEAFRAEVAPMRAYITRQEAAEQRATQEQRSNFERENIAFVNRLVAEKKLESGRVMEVAAYADTMASRLGRNVGIEEAYKTLTSYGAAKESPPPSLRADAGAIGVPANSTTTSDRWKTDLHGYLVDTIKSAQKAS